MEDPATLCTVPPCNAQLSGARRPDAILAPGQIDQRAGAAEGFELVAVFTSKCRWLAGLMPGG